MMVEPSDRALTRMVLFPSEWVRRRVETVSYSESGETRHRVSLDIQVPAGYLEHFQGREAVPVPLGLLRKAPLARFDMRDAQGSALPVLETPANGAIAERVLITALQAAEACREVPPEDVARAVHNVVYAEPSDADAVASTLRSLLGSSSDDGPAAIALQLARELAHCFLLVVSCPRETVEYRTVLKFEYEDAISVEGGFRWPKSDLAIELDCPAMGSCASFHIEVRTPNGTGCRELLIGREQGTPGGGSLHRFAGRGPTAHANFAPGFLESGFRAQVVLVPERRGIVTWAAGASCTLASAFIGTAFAWDHGLLELLQDPGTGAALAAVVLAIPAFLFALLARTPEHFLVSRILRPARRTLLGTSLLMLCAASTMIIAPSFGFRVMLGIGMLQALLAARAILAWKASDPGPIVTGTAQSTEKG